MKRCFLNNVLQRFDKKDKGTTGTKDFTRLAFPPTMRKIQRSMWKPLTNAHMCMWKCYKHREIARKAFECVGGEHIRSHFWAFTNTPEGRGLKAPELNKISPSLPLHYAVFVCSLLSFCSAIFGAQEFLGKPQKFNLTRRDNFSITFASQIKREEREDRMEMKFWRKSWSSYAWKWKYKAWILCLLL